MQTIGLPNSLYNTGLKKKRIVGIVLVAIFLTLFLAFNRVPKLDTVQADLAIATSPVAECFQGFCLEESPDKSLLSRWWDFSLTYLRLVTVGMTFAFLVAGTTEAFLFPKSGGLSLTATGIKGSLKGLLVGPAMNLCSACIVPVAAAFRRRGSGVETTLAITQGSSTLNLPAMIMTAMVFAPLIGGSRIGLSLVGALLIGPLVAKIVRDDNSNIELTGLITGPVEPDDTGWKEAISDGFRDMVKITSVHVIRLAPVMILAGFASGLAIQWISPQTVTAWLGDDVLGILIAATVGIAINVPLLFEIPLVAVLLMAGMGTAPAAALLFTAAAGGPITFWGLAKVMPAKVVAAFGASTWGLGAAGGLLVLVVVSMSGENGFGLRADYGTSANPSVESQAELQQTSSSAMAIQAERSSVVFAPSTIRFTDVTQQAGITYQHSVPDLIVGKPEPADMVAGAVAEDFDGDGWIDLFVLRGVDTPSYLYMNHKNGSFVDEANARGALLPTNMGMSAAAADYDNDGDIDIVVTNQEAPHYLLINDGTGNFNIDDTMLTEPKSLATSPSWGDVDNDGMLELVLGEWNSETAQAYEKSTNTSSDVASPVDVRPNSNEGTNSLNSLFLYRNNGKGQLEPYEFRESRAVDLWVFAPRFADLNNDGLTDLAVVADFGLSKLYQNVGDGMFKMAPGTEDSFTDENGMGSAIGDYDNDGDLDWFVSSIFGQSIPEKASHGGTGNRLYRNDTNMNFTDATDGARVRNGSWGWGASFGDLDNDGDLDLFHVNGWIQDEEEGDPVEFDDKAARLFENKGAEGFHEVAEETGSDDRGQGRGVILFDFDNDGDQDIFITNNHEYTVDGDGSTRSPGTPSLLRNDTANGNHWLRVTLEGKPPLHRNGIGSRVYVTVGEVTQMRELHASTNYATQEPGRIAYFGLGEATVIDEVRTEWNNGEVSILTNVSADQHINISSR